MNNGSQRLLRTDRRRGQRQDKNIESPPGSGPARLHADYSRRFVAQTAQDWPAAAAPYYTRKLVRAGAEHAEYPPAGPLAAGWACSGPVRTARRTIVSTARLDGRCYHYRPDAFGNATCGRPDLFQRSDNDRRRRERASGDRWHDAMHSPSPPSRRRTHRRTRTLPSTTFRWPPSSLLLCALTGVFELIESSTVGVSWNYAAKGDFYTYVQGAWRIVAVGIRRVCCVLQFFNVAPT